MKFYISADIEGISGISNREESADRTGSFYPYYARQMTAEVTAACKGAYNKGTGDILIKDGHGVHRNLIATELPEEASFIRGKSGHPFRQLDGLDSSFDAILMIGYHSRAGSGGNPLSHTYIGHKVFDMSINEKPVSEFLLNSYIAEYVGVPVIFLSGDERLCSEAKIFNPSLETLAVTKGKGDSCCSINPLKACKQITEGVERALSGDLQRCRVKLPIHINFKLSFIHHADAYKASFYPGVEVIDDRSILLQTEDLMDVLIMIGFVL